MSRAKHRRRQPGLWADWGEQEPARWDPAAYPRLVHFSTPKPYDWTWITDQLATGGMPLSAAEMSKLVAEGVTHVVNVSGDYRDIARTVEEADKRVRYLWNPADDDGRVKPAEWFQRTVDFAVPAIENGDRVYVHCLCGKNRGPSSAMAVLIALGHPADEAEEMIRTRRPRAQLLYAEDARRAAAG